MNSNKKLFRYYKACVFTPIKLCSHLQDAKIPFSLPPHTDLLGAGNDVCNKLRKQAWTRFDIGSRKNLGDKFLDLKKLERR